MGREYERVKDRYRQEIICAAIDLIDWLGLWSLLAYVK